MRRRPITLVANVALLLLTAGCLSGGRRRVEAVAVPTGPDATTVVADIEAMVEGFPLHLNLAIRAVENARAARNEAESLRLAALGERPRRADPRLATAERESAAALAESAALLELMVARMIVIEERLQEALTLVDAAQERESDGGRGLSRRQRNRLRHLHEASQSDYNAITGMVVRLKGRWLLPKFDDGEPSPATP